MDEKVTFEGSDASRAYPDIAEDATDLRQLKKAVEDAASVSGGLWLSYLFVLFYLAIAAGAVTHVDLFFERPVKLPFLNIELPLLAFFSLAPILFLLTHVYTLVHFVLLTDKAKRFHAELRRQIAGTDHPDAEREADAIRNAVRRQLPSNIFVQFLAGPDDLRGSFFGLLLKSIAWATLVIGPVLLLLLLQFQFLPFHSGFVIWTIRVAVLIDLAFIWWLWRLILSGRSESDRSRLAPAGRPVGFVLTVVIAFVSFAAATFPGEVQDKSSLCRLAHRILFGSVSGSSGSDLSSHLSSTLVLTGLNLYEGLNVDDPQKVAWRPFLFLARGRDLKGANFGYAVLPKVDFGGAHLEGASFFKTQLRGASFAEAHMQGASLDDAQLQAASLREAQLQTARFYHTQLQGADLTQARLQGASFELAQLQGASLAQAQLQGASLDGAQLQGASFHLAQLQGASLEDADLHGTSFALAQAQGASFARARLAASDLSLAVLWRVSLDAVEADTILLSEVRWDPVMRLEHRSYRDFVPWTSQAYDPLESEMNSLPPGGNRDDALSRIAAADPAAAFAQDNNEDRARFEAAKSAEAPFETALAGILRGLVCRGDLSSIDIMRGLLANNILASTGRQLPALLEYAEGPHCPVSKQLTDEDRAKLQVLTASLSKESR